jgi:hypothetical protein
MLAPAPTDRFQSARAARAALLGGVVRSPSTVTVGRPGRQALASFDWEPAPRQLTGRTRAQFDKVAYTPWQLLDAESKNAKPTITDRVLVAFFSVLTAGILPMIIWSRARSRRNLLKPFFISGLPARATVLDVVRETIEFGAKLARVQYEFEADGARHRGSDWVLPVLAARWQPGDEIDVLYLHDDDYDSVIVSTR